MNFSMHSGQRGIRSFGPTIGRSLWLLRAAARIGRLDSLPFRVEHSLSLCARVFQSFFLVMTFRILNLAEARFECTFGRGCDGVCCRNGRPIVYPEEGARLDEK